ncbi:RING-H2 finger protein ATL16 isoform X2 [Medicago truncatula]|nr:RING-H2 finger protein ATL16 isoform X2 [Medicago truncatula]
MNRIIAAPSSSPQDSQLLSNMGSDEDFVVIELWGDGENRGSRSQVQQDRNESRERLETLSRTHSTTRKTEEKKKAVQLKPWKCHHGTIMDDECIDVRKKDDQFSIQPIRRSFSLDSASDRKAYVDVQHIIQQNNRHQNEDCGINSEGCNYEDCNSSSNRGRRSFFPFRYGRV